MANLPLGLLANGGALGKGGIGPVTQLHSRNSRPLSGLLRTATRVVRRRPVRSAWVGRLVANLPTGGSDVAVGQWCKLSAQLARYAGGAHPGFAAQPPKICQGSQRQAIHAAPHGGIVVSGILVGHFGRNAAGQIDSCRAEDQEKPS